MDLGKHDSIELFCRVIDKPGMYLPARGFDAVWSFIEGYDAAQRSEALRGFREWLIVQRGLWTNLPWFMIIRERVLPDSDPGTMPKDENEHELLKVELKRCLLDFDATRKQKGVAGILRDYEPLWEAERCR